MERNQSYHTDQDDIDFMLKIINQNAERARQQREYEQRQSELVQRARYQNIGHNINTVIQQNNRAEKRAERLRQRNKLRKFAIGMTTMILVTTVIATSINASADVNEKNNNANFISHNTSISYEKPKESPEDLTSIIFESSTDQSFEEPEEYEQHIHHYKSENLNRENLSADEFCKNLDDFLTSNEKLIGNNLEEKAWDLLYNQVGCSGEQSAAIIGNMLVEDPSLNPYQHQVFEGISNKTNDEIVNNTLGIGPFQFSGDRKKSFLKFVETNTQYNDLYDKFTNPKKYSALTKSTIFDTDLSRFGLTEEDCDRGLECIFAYVSYEMLYPDDSGYSCNQWNKFAGDGAKDDPADTTDLAIRFAQYFERTQSGYERRIDEAEKTYSKYLTFGTT